MISLSEKTLEDLGLCWVGKKLCPSPAYMAEIIMNNIEGHLTKHDEI